MTLRDRTADRAFYPVSIPAGGRPQLFCLPFAGGSANCFDAWTPLLARVADVWVAELPGRGSRFGVPPAGDLDALVTDLAAEVAERPAGPLVLFGHSMGAVLAFELALRLQDRDATPACLVLSGQPAPNWPRGPHLHLLDDERLTAAARALGGTPPEVFESPELWALMLPVLRADLCMVEGHPFRPGAVVSCPVVAYGATGDSDATAEALAGWAAMTTGPFAYRVFHGDHFYLLAQPEVFAADLARRVLRHAGPLSRITTAPSKEER